MPIRLDFRRSGSIQRHLEAIRSAVAENGGPARRARTDIRKLVIEDHEEAILGRSVDRFGRPFAPLSPRTLADPRRGPGPILAPHGHASRIIANYRADWSITRAGVYTLLAKLVDVPDWFRFHTTGTRRMPRRDFAGTTPKGLAAIRRRFKEFVAEIAAGKG